MRSPLATLAATLLLGACTYDFTNPAEKLDSGEVAGRTVADLSGTGDLSPLAGVTVQLKNSTNVQTSRDNGRFFLLGLVPGRHTLLFSKGTTWALQRDIEVGFDSTGQPESVLLGDTRLRYSVVIGGTFTVTLDAFQPVVPTAFVIDEATGARQPAVPETDGFGNYTGRFSYSFPAAPVGLHRIRFAVAGYSSSLPVTYVGGPLTQSIPDSSEGQSLTLTPPTLHPAAAGVTGKLRLRVQRPAGTAMPAVLINTVPGGAAVTGVPAPDSTGVFEMDLDEGFYSVSLDLGAAAGGTLEVPAPMEAVVIADQTTELGTLYVVDYTTVSEADFSCLDSSDCFAMYSCVDRTCVFSAPTLQACLTGDFSTECANAEAACSASGAATQCSGGAGFCAIAPDMSFTCVPVGRPECLWNGSQPAFAICFTLP